MNQSQAIELFCSYMVCNICGGGPGSGCNPAVGNCGRPTGNTETRRGLKSAVMSVVKDAPSKTLAKKAIQIMSRQRVDERLWSGKGLAEFFRGTPTDPLNVALYSNQKDRLITYKGITARDVVHELGHHLDYKWLKDSAINREASKQDVAKATALKNSIEKEFKVQQEHAMAKFPGENVRDAWQKMEADPKVLSPYAMYNKEEFFAEAFMTYFSNPSRLESTSPRTYDAMKTFLGGKLLKRS